MEKRTFPGELKALTDEGTFEGYAAVFGNVDLGGDRIEPGAFAKTLKRGGAFGHGIKMLWNHNANDVIGTWPQMEEKEKGLFGQGRFTMAVAKAKEVYALAKDGAIGGLSIGYMTVKSVMDGNVRVLKEVELYEVSLVTFPMNTASKITGIKSENFEGITEKLAAGERLTEREFEQMAKGLGLTNSQAERAARIHLKGQGEPAEAAKRAQDFLKALRG